MNLLEIFTENKPNKIAVIGDIILDRYIKGEVERLSPEEPIPVVKYQGDYLRLGGAANVSLNVHRFGLEVYLIGCVGHDLMGSAIRQQLEIHGIKSGNLISINRPTTTKLRIGTDLRNFVRVDDEQVRDLDPEEEDQVISQLKLLFQEKLSVIILSDYDKGVLTPKICQLVIEYGRQNNIPVIVDPKGTNSDKYHGAFGMLPNQVEFQQLFQKSFLNCLQSDMQNILKKYNLDFLTVTRGKDGMSLSSKDEDNVHFQSFARHVFDVTGAGDTVISFVGISIALGIDLRTAHLLATIAAGFTVTKSGTVAPTQYDLLQEFIYRKLISPLDRIVNYNIATNLVHVWQSQGEKVIFAYGIFNSLTMKDVLYLERAHDFGERLIVGILSDNAVKHVHVNGNIIHDQKERAHLVSHLTGVDLVVIIDINRVEERQVFDCKIIVESSEMSYLFPKSQSDVENKSRVDIIIYDPLT